MTPPAQLREYGRYGMHFSRFAVLRTSEATAGFDVWCQSMHHSRRHVQVALLSLGQPDSREPSETVSGTGWNVAKNMLIMEGLR